MVNSAMNTADPWLTASFANSPEGMSIATLSAFASFRLLTTSLKMPSSGLERPEPKRPSIIISSSSICGKSLTPLMIAYKSDRSRFSLKSSEPFLGSPTTYFNTSQPLLLRILPMAKPSPPLFPDPQKIRTSRFFGKNSRNLLTNDSAARSIKSMDAIGSFFMVNWSACLTCSDVRILIIYLLHP